jgi:hypothetical protein
MPVSAQINVTMIGTLIGTNTFSGGPFWTGDIAVSQAFSDGVGADQANRLYMSERTIAASSNDDIDLNAVLLDALGGGITAVELVTLFVLNRRRDATLAANTTNLTLGGSGSGVPGYTAASDVIKPGGFVIKSNPDATGLATITGGTGDILRISNGAGGSNTYCIGLLLRTA